MLLNSSLALSSSSGLNTGSRVLGNSPNEGRFNLGSEDTLSEQATRHSSMCDGLPPKPSSTAGDAGGDQDEKNWKAIGLTIVNGGAAFLKLISATSKFFGLNLPDFASENVTRGAMVGQCAIGLIDAIDQKNSPQVIGQTAEIGLVCMAADEDKWLLRGISQGFFINIAGPVIKGYERLQQALGKNIEAYDANYSELPFLDSIKKSFSIPFKVYKDNIIEICKKPSLLTDNITYALSLASTFMYSGGLLGLTPFKKLASCIRFLGAIPADVIYAFMGHHTEEGYDIKNKYNLKEIFNFKSPLGLAGKLWLVPGFLDPIKRLPVFENVADVMTDVCDAFDRCASGFYQMSLCKKQSTSSNTEVIPNVA